MVERWSDPQLGLFSPQGYGYYGIASNRDELSAEEVVWFHNQRGQAENLIKELKTGFGMEQMTSGDFSAHAPGFAIGVRAYNLTQAQKLLFLAPGWQLIETGGRLIRHARRLILRLATSLEKDRLFLEIRRLWATFH